MKKLIIFSATALLILSSCVSKKEFAALESKQKETEKQMHIWPYFSIFRFSRQRLRDWQAARRAGGIFNFSRPGRRPEQ